MTDDEDSNSLPPGTTLAAATKGTRLQLLTVARRRLAEVIDGNVPVHALARLMTELDRLDSEIRRLESLPPEDDDPGLIEDEPFDPSTI
ncbi:hypothetical protein [Microbacterium sp. S1037]|uniref:hypothetical protein n=1 Tax=Microbacterium sp. S1037 TaxID=3398227 RepID=UPI003AAE3EE4